MPILRITKRYLPHSKLAGIVEMDKVQFAERDDAAAFLLTVTQNRRVDYEILDAEWVLIDLANGAEIIDNPTGGFLGVIKDVRQYGVR